MFANPADNLSSRIWRRLPPNDGKNQNRILARHLKMSIFSNFYIVLRQLMHICTYIKVKIP
jgi:hypothetical protein